jgi:hypothetical protein
MNSKKTIFSWGTNDGNPEQFIVLKYENYNYF